MGQYIQEGPRNMFETVLMVQQSNNELIIPELEGNPDSMNFLAGKRLDEINRMAALGTMLAHTDGGVPVIQISIPENEERYLGQMIYFFEKACALSAYHLGVNPFDQPGVEMYKKNMYALLGKPGFEAQTAELRRKLEME